MVTFMFFFTSRNVMIGDYFQGGLKMIDIQSFNKAQHLEVCGSLNILMSQT